MRIKRLIIAAMAILAAILMVGCSAKKDPATTATQAPTDAATQAAQAELTLEELAAFNGKDGKAAYVAVDGVIYDVTNVPQWENGAHSGYEAGKDLTEFIAKSPHGKAVLQGLPVIGVLKTGS